MLDPYLAREKQPWRTCSPSSWTSASGRARPTPPRSTPPCTSYVLVHNLRVWRAEGVPAPDPRQPLTWPELTDRARRLSKELDGKFTQLGYDGANVHDVFLSFQQASGKTPFNEDFDSWNMDQPEAISQIQLLADMHRSQKAAGWPGAPQTAP